MQFLPDSLAGTLDSALRTSCTMGSSGTCFHLEPQHKKHPGGKRTHITDRSLPLIGGRGWIPVSVTDTHPVALIATDKKWYFVRHEISAGDAAVTPRHQQHSAFHHSSYVGVTPSYRSPT